MRSVRVYFGSSVNISTVLYLVCVLHINIGMLYLLACCVAFFGVPSSPVFDSLGVFVFLAMVGLTVFISVMNASASHLCSGFVTVSKTEIPYVPQRG